MIEPILPAVTGVVGVAVGALIPCLFQFVQQRAQHRRERVEYATQVALEDYKNIRQNRIERGAGGTMAPVVMWIHYHVRMAELLEANKLTPEAIERVTNEAHALTVAAKQAFAKLSE